MKYIVLLALIAMPLCAMEIPMENAVQTAKIPSDKFAAAKKIVSQAGMQEKSNIIQALVETFKLMEQDPQLSADPEAQKMGINAAKRTWYALRTAQKASKKVRQKISNAETPEAGAENTSSPSTVNQEELINLIKESTHFIAEATDLILGNKTTETKKQKIYTISVAALGIVGTISGIVCGVVTTYYTAGGADHRCNCTG